MLPLDVYSGCLLGTLILFSYIYIVAIANQMEKTRAGVPGQPPIKSKYLA